MNVGVETPTSRDDERLARGGPAYCRSRRLLNRAGGVLGMALAGVLLAGCSTLDDAMAVTPAPALEQTVTTTTPGDTASAPASESSPTTGTSDSDTAQPTTTGSETTASEPADAGTLANGSIPGAGAVTCPGDVLGYGITSGFEFALCDSDADRAVFRRVNLSTGDIVEGSACLGDKIWTAYIRDWRYDIDLKPATPELVIVDDHHQQFLREALSDYMFLVDTWESRHYC